MKRLFDFMFSFFLLILLALPLLCLSLIVLYNFGWPVLFRQERAGIHGKPFKIIKFRSMTNERGSNGLLLPDTRRMTPFGRFLRSSSLDELPELWNVFLGEMSFVGPRPLLIEYLPLYSPHQFRRHEVRPGITGYAQVNGRNAITWEEKFLLDVWYVDNLNLFLDFTILLKTFFKVAFMHDVTTPSGDVMPIFKGSVSTFNPHD